MVLSSLIQVVAVSYLISQTSATECLVSQWSAWSDCIGTCQYAEVVRNRDVVEPPLPETLAGGGTYRKVCPILYETKTCMPSRCSKIENDMPRPNPLIIDENSSAQNTNESDISQIQSQNDVEVIEENSVNNNDDSEKNFLSSAVEGLSPMSAPVETFSPDEIKQLSKKRSEKFAIQESFQTPSPLRRIEVTTSPYVNNYVNRLTFDMPLKKMFSSDMEKRLQRRLNISKIHYRDLGGSGGTTTTVPEIKEPSVEQVLAELEAAGDMNIPWDDKHLRKAIRKNKKLMKALMDAYKFKRNSNKVSEVGYSNAINSLPVSTTTSAPIPIQEVTANPTPSSLESSSIQYWQHQKGFVPNTRKHASEITNKLYMTKEIVQALSDDVIRRVPILRIECLENSRCCRVERTECPDGTRPSMVRRFYRPPGSPICVPYHYPKCSQLEEMDERPIEFEQNCQDLCFAGPEKRISPLLASDFHH